MAITLIKPDTLAFDVGAANIELDNGAASAFKVMLLGATYTASAAHATVADIVAHELPTANGYTAGGKALTGVTYTRSGAVSTFDADDISWTVSGSPLTSYAAAIFYDAGASTNAQRELVAIYDFGGAQVGAVGQPFTIYWPVSGIIQVQ